MKLIVSPVDGAIRGDVHVPVSKYHLHRALILGSLAEGTTVIHGRSGCRHIGDTLQALRDLGIDVETTPDGYRVIGGPYRPRNGNVRVGSSGSTLQFMLGLGCRSAGGAVTFRGNRFLQRRPIGPLLDAFSQTGIAWQSRDHRLPVTIRPGLPSGGRIRIRGTLSQWISGLLMVAPLATRQTVVEVIPPFNERNYVMLTLRMMREFGIRFRGGVRGARWVVPGRQHYRACTVDLEADFSSAAFLLGLAALHPADLTLRGIDTGSEHPEGRIPAIIAEMGVPMRADPNRRTLTVRHRGLHLKPVVVDMKTIPDFMPMMTVLAAAAAGRSVLKNVGPCRLKESDRVRAMLQLRTMGACVEERGDDLIVDGGRPLTGASLSSYDDHRVEMALVIAGTMARGTTRLTYPHAYEISYPEFPDHLRSLGVRLAIR